MDEYLYTILIPFKGEISLLERLLVTIPDRQDIQVLIIDNNEKEAALPANYFEDRNQVFVLYSAPGKGCGCARNVGIEQTRGKWAICADADDFFHPGAFAVFDSYRDSVADVIYFCADSCYSETGLPASRGKYTAQLVDQYLSGRISLNSFKYKYFMAANKMIRTQFLRNHEIRFEEIMSGEDIVFSVLTAYYAGKIEVDRSIVYCITVSNKGENITQKKKKDFSYLEASYKALIRANLFLKRQNLGRYQSPLYRYLLYAGKYGWKEMFHFIRIARKNKVSLFIGWRHWYKVMKWFR